MREIKFRAWHKDGQMFYECAINRVGQPAQFGEDAILMQYTGFKDKNSKEIYEGDIVKPTKSSIVNKVCWEDGQFVLKWADNHTNIRLSQALADIHEVIGNIYENPELLEEK